MRKVFRVLKGINWKSCMLGIALGAMILLTFNLTLLPSKDELRRLQDAINNCPYSPLEYKRGTFDCSNMANMLDDWLEQKYGYETYIASWRNINFVEGHAMVIANGVFIEPTTKSICFTFNTPLYEDLSTSVTIVEDAEQLPSYSTQEWGYPSRW